MSISFIIDGSKRINFGLVEGVVPPPVAPDHPRYQEIVKAIGEGDGQAILNLTAPVDVKAKKLDAWTEGEMALDPVLRSVTYNGEAVHHVVVDKAFGLMELGLPYAHLLRFLERLYRNPSRRAVHELYGFLEHAGITISETGMCLGYKRVRAADAAGRYFDHHTGRFEYAIGVEARVPRNTVDENPDVECSHGLHVGSLSYVSHFCAGSPVAIVEFDPADVVSVPRHDTTKIRVCAMTPLKFVDESELGLALSAPCYKAEVGSVVPSTPASNGAPYDDDDDDDEGENVEEAKPFAGEIPPAYVMTLVPGSSPADWEKHGGAWFHVDAGVPTVVADYQADGVVYLPDSDLVDLAEDEDLGDADRSATLWLVSGSTGRPVVYEGGNLIGIGCQRFPYATWMNPEFQARQAESFGVAPDDLDFYRRAVLAIAMANNLK